MKYFGCVAEHAHERARDLFKAYRSYISTCRHISPNIYVDIVNMPAPRFYVSRQRAANVVCRILKGDDLSYMHFNKREMFFDIFQRYLVKKRENPRMGVSKIVGMVIREPAPKFYIAAGRAKSIIREEKNQWHKEYLKKLLRSH